MRTALEDQIAALRPRQYMERPWRSAEIHEALGVPAFLQAVTLISNMMGIFTLEGYRNGEKVDPDDRPSLIKRPNPFTTLRDYLRETAWSMATRGESWQWIGSRDGDGMALSLIPVPSREVVVEGDWLTPTIRWRQQEKTRDMRAIFLTKELGDTRGKGPLQYCGAAISAAVESQEWAANFYASGGFPSVVMHSEDELLGNEAQDLKDAWTNTPPNMPHVTSGPISVEQTPTVSEGSAQALDSRNWNAGEGARMWSIPGALLEYSRGGSSLTYQNVVSLMDQLLKQCLIPNYLEPTEQMITDQLPRSWATRFNVDAVLRADIKTRFEVYESGLRSGVYVDTAEPRAIEGLAGGNIENAAVPYSPPQAIPTIGPELMRSASDVRCNNCGRFLAELATMPYRLRCRDCKSLTVAA
jgi:HK97 family phage portal protein